MSPTREEIQAALEVFQSEIATTDVRWARSVVIDVLTAAEKERSHNLLGEPKLCASADE